MEKKTFLHEEQIKLGAKMVPFASWEMPVQYSGIIDEHKTVRNDVGLFDVSHMGETVISGKDSVAFLNSVLPQEISTLPLNKALYCQLTNDRGGIIDDLIVYKLDNEKFLLIVNASRIDEDLNWLVRNSLGFDVSIDNRSHNYSLFALQGPKAEALLEELGLKKEEQPNFFMIKRAKLFNINLFISRTGYTGEDGFEILIQNHFSVYLWNKILEAGKKFNIKPIGLGARDTLRLEAGLHLYGNDMDETTTPVEASLAWSVAKNKPDNYNGKGVIENQLKNGVNKKLIGFKMLERAIARHGYKIFYNDEQIGEVTSGGFSPTLNENIGMGYINTKFNLKTGDYIKICVREKLYDAQIVKRPFVDKKYKTQEEK